MGVVCKNLPKTASVDSECYSSSRGCHSKAWRPAALADPACISNGTLNPKP